METFRSKKLIINLFVCLLIVGFVASNQNIPSLENEKNYSEDNEVLVLKSSDLNQRDVNVNHAILNTSINDSKKVDMMPKEVQEALHQKIKDSYLVNRSISGHGETLPKFMNYEQKFVAGFQGSQITLSPILASDEWLFEMKLAGYGGLEQIVPVGSGESTFNGNRAEIDYGNITEWYINRSSGIEHGFTIHQPPGDEDTLIFKMEVDTNLNVEVQSDKLGISLRNEDETVLYYSGLYVEDAEGNKLYASLDADSSHWEITVEGLQSAHYPITVDPTFYTVQKISGSSPTFGNNFGLSMDIDRNSLVVGSIGISSGPGSPFDGVAYVFENVGGEWIESAKLSSSQVQFAHSIAVQGNWIAIGDFGNEANGLLSGAVSLLQRQSDGTWMETQNIFGSSILSLLGYSLDMSGNRLAVGSSGENTSLPGGGTGQGTVRVYEYDSGPNQWVLQQVVFAENPTVPPFFTGEGFAQSVALLGDILVVGAPIAVDSQSQLSGAIYVFNYEELSQTWVESQRVYANDSVSLMRFGDSVTLNNNFIAVGSPGLVIESGAAYIFSHNEGMILDESKLTASDQVFNARFGGSISLSENRILIGAPGAFDSSFPIDKALGSAYFFINSPDFGWVQEKKFVSNSENFNDLGKSVAISKNFVIAGDPLNGGPNTFPGEVQIWNLNNQAMKK